MYLRFLKDFFRFIYLETSKIEIESVLDFCATKSYELPLNAGFVFLGVITSIAALTAALPTAAFPIPAQVISSFFSTGFSPSTSVFFTKGMPV